MKTTMIKHGDNEFTVLVVKTTLYNDFTARWRVLSYKLVERGGRLYVTSGDCPKSDIVEEYVEASLSDARDHAFFSCTPREMLRAFERVLAGRRASFIVASIYGPSGDGATREIMTLTPHEKGVLLIAPCGEERVVKLEEAEQLVAALRAL